MSSEVIGNFVNLTPIALYIAFAMAAGGVSIPISPTDFAP
jgi:hypothetical protein